MGNSSGNGDTTSTLPKINPSQLLDEWASWERNHSDANQVDPTVEQIIHITYPPGVSANAADGVGGGMSSNDPCGAYLIAASTGLRGGLTPEKPDPAKLEKFSQCMRANGIPDFPDPSSDAVTLHSQAGSDRSTENSIFKNASELCARRTGLPFFGNGTPKSWSIDSLGTQRPGRQPRGGCGHQA
jgi:hypothetical protein